MLCGVGYGLFTRRHHCRLCGGVFCAHCTAQQADIPKLSLHGVRVCNICFRLPLLKPSMFPRFLHPIRPYPY
jgi:hypothetical protein